MWFFCTFFLFSSPKTWKSHTYSIFFNRHENGAFLMKNIQNHKYSIIYTFFLQYYGTFRRLNALSSLRTETRKKTWNIWGNPLLATYGLYFYLIYISKNTAFSYPYEFLYEKNRHESSLFLKKNVKNQKYNILWTSLFALQKHTALMPI